MKRHIRDNYFVVGEGIYDVDSLQRGCQRPSTMAALRKFRFSRMGPKGTALDDALLQVIAERMTVQQGHQDSAIPAGYTYLGQFVDHDLTMDKTAVSLGQNVTVEDLIQGRSPALDLDSLYGLGPGGEDARFYSDGVRLKMGRTAATNFPDPGPNVDLDGFDLPCTGFGSNKSDRRKALIPDLRNDENLAVAQTHLAFIRFHNRVVDKLAAGGTPSAILFERARDLVVRHYQWMLVHDYLPRIVDPAIVAEVFTNGRRFFEVHLAPAKKGGYQSYMVVQPGDMPTMPIEFSVAAFRLGHSMVRETYEWNRVFNSGRVPATLALLFTFSGTAGILSPDGNIADPESGSFERLPTSWIADFRRLFDFAQVGRNDLAVTAGKFNLARLIDTLLVDPLAALPSGSFGPATANPPAIVRNLAFRNLVRAKMVELASGQQMAELMGVTPLSAQDILVGNGGADLTDLPQAQQDAIVENTPLWFYILREAELNGGLLTGVGGRIVAEVFHRAIEGSATSIVRDPLWRPSLGAAQDRFLMADLLLFAFDGDQAKLNPLGD